MQSVLVVWSRKQVGVYHAAACGMRTAPPTRLELRCARPHYDTSPITVECCCYCLGVPAGCTQCIMSSAPSSIQPFLLWYCSLFDSQAVLISLNSPLGNRLPVGLAPLFDHGPEKEGPESKHMSASWSLRLRLLLKHGYDCLKSSMLVCMTDSICWHRLVTQQRYTSATSALHKSRPSLPAYIYYIRRP